MTDPYRVLNINSNATDEEVKQAYRKLAKRYHPDNYINNELADLAAEKMKEINAAYDEINRLRSE
ncbi:MAG TPA: molecular chaperone DnaJ, partial [Clostridiales bacterium]|nr:molecular chaperone DnaJ [Clostridiales bacterium]